MQACYSDESREAGRIEEGEKRGRETETDRQRDKDRDRGKTIAQIAAETDRSIGRPLLTSLAHR